MGGWLADLRYGARLLSRAPGFTLVAVTTLALGIGANAAIFSVVNTILLRPLPVPDPDRMVAIRALNQGDEFGSASYPDFLDLKDGTDLFDGMLVHTLVRVALSEAGGGKVLFGELVSSGYFEALRVRPALGRGFLPQEDQPGSSPVVVLSHDFWTSLGSDRAMVGRPLLLNARPFTVVGVAPAGFHGTKFGLGMEFWTPMSAHAVVQPGTEGILEDRGSHWLETRGRLKAGVSIARADAALKTVAERMRRTNPDSDRDLSVQVVPEREGTFPATAVTPLKLGMALALGVAGLVLAIACANVAGLLLARALSRRREIGIRLALGAGRGRIVRQLLAESLLLALLGGGAGILLAMWAGDLLLTFLPPLPYRFAVDYSPDGRVILYTAALSLAATLLAGLAPAMAATRPSLVPALKGEEVGSRRRLTLRHLLVVGQAALCLVVMASAGLLARSLANAQTIDTGFARTGALLASFDLGLLGYQEEDGRRLADRLVEEVRALPGVAGAGLLNLMPLGDSHSSSGPVLAEGQAEPEPGSEIRTDVNVVTPGLFGAMGMPILRGRDFGPGDDAVSTPVAILSQELARRLWPGEDPIGRRYRIGSSGPLREVIGVVGDVKSRTLAERTTAHLYRPLSQAYRGALTLVVKAAGEPGPLAGPVRGAVERLDPRLPIYDLRTIERHLEVSLWWNRMTAMMAGVFGLLALALAALGLYGLMAWLVGRRRKEVGLRMALGATTADVVRLVVGQGMRLAVAGLALGLVGALAVGRVLASLLYGVGMGDLPTMAASIGVFGAAALAACWLPARRAARVDPMDALRCE